MLDYAVSVTAPIVGGPPSHAIDAGGDALK